MSWPRTAIHADDTTVPVLARHNVKMPEHHIAESVRR
jgi:hypothetical protein